MGADEAIEIGGSGTGEGKAVGEVVAAEFVDDPKGLVTASGSGFVRAVRTA